MLADHPSAESLTAGLDLEGQTWVVTGTTSGLGAETARVLRLRGARVLGINRAEGTDLGDRAAVHAAVSLLSAQAPLAGIVCNAAVLALPDLQQVGGLERQMAVNHLGHVQLVTGLAEALSPASRIVVVTSEAMQLVDASDLIEPITSASYDPWLAYGRSKLANWLFVRALSARGFTANAAHPGPVRTRLARHLPDPDGLYDAISEHVKPIGHGAATQVKLAVDPTLAGLTGRYFSDCAEEPPPTDATDEDAEQLWDWSQAQLG